ALFRACVNVCCSSWEKPQNNAGSSRPGPSYTESVHFLAATRLSSWALPVAIGAMPFAHANSLSIRSRPMLPFGSVKFSPMGEASGLSSVIPTRRARRNGTNKARANEFSNLQNQELIQWVGLSSAQFSRSVTLALLVLIPQETGWRKRWRKLVTNALLAILPKTTATRFARFLATGS